MPAITPTRADNFPEWYQQVIKASELAENAPVRGCMIIKPWGWSIWEEIRAYLDRRIRETGHQNAYFPLFIPMSFLEKEAAHVEGFAKECAVVTHHRLELQNGHLVPTGELEDPLIVRPTSETIIGDAFSRWVQSWRDLPLLINQWANVVRWEMRPRLFLRTTEFLWQEGHTVHATAEEAEQETAKMLEVYREVAEELLAIPVIMGEKSPGERFPGAEHTYTIEAIMQDGKALQGGTSHYLGQNFSRAFNIRFSTPNGDLEYGHTTSWGFTTRLIGALIMVHGDDDGLRLPPRVSPYHGVIIPVRPSDEVMAYCKRAQEAVSGTYEGRSIAIHVDTRDLGGGDKQWQWIKRGVPLRIECGPRDMERGVVMVARRDRPHAEKEAVPLDRLQAYVEAALPAIQKNYHEQAQAVRQSFRHEEVRTLEECKAFFNNQAGFVVGKWCGDPATEEALKEQAVTIRCLPLAQSGTEGKCLLTGRPATLDAVFAKSY